MDPSRSRLRDALKAAAVVTASVAALCVPLLGSASPAFAEPNPCTGRGDEGHGGRIIGTGVVTVYGTWYNCSGGTGADRVKLIVGNGTDGPCITVPYGSTGSSTLQRPDLWPATPYYDGWRRC